MWFIKRSNSDKERLPEGFVFYPYVNAGYVLKWATETYDELIMLNKVYDNGRYHSKKQDY
jgi:hypothetical protein